MKKILGLVVLFLLSFSVMAQNKIPGTKVTFDFPRGGWKYLQTIKVDENTNVYLYSYSHKLLVDEEGDTILPNMRIYVRKNYTKDVFDLVMERYMMNPYQSLEEYTDNLPAPGIGYKGIYQSGDNKYYKFDMIYFKEKNVAFEFRLETTNDTYEQVEDDFVQILNTISIEK